MGFYLLGGHFIVVYQGVMGFKGFFYNICLFKLGVSNLQHRKFNQIKELD